jgi:hypothetical protein
MMMMQGDNNNVLSSEARRELEKSKKRAKTKLQVEADKLTVRACWKDISLLH